MNLFLSIVIPAYNEENRLPHTLEQVFHFLEKQPFSSEILVVENGSNDRTFEIAQEYASRLANVHVLHSEQRGKGLAIQRGVMVAAGEYVFMCDADLSMPVEEIQKFIPPQLQNVDIAIASREASGSVRYNEPYYRHFTGRVFNTLIRLLVLPGLQDTQCGFKCIRAQVARDIFPYQTLTGWAFDVELLFIARRLGYRIVEIPIDWYFNADSKISVVRDSLRMFLDLLRIRRNARRGLYDPKP
ncbi:MAG TPA: dolichyl-phosphate beta-glucosyltransferase [Anaerolineales bacterium]|nr:dolichyl-phosphate beta-glucosyltransferase [Anaerolineales bacterium]